MKALKVGLILLPAILVASAFGPSWLWIASALIMSAAIIALVGFKEWVDKEKQYGKLVPARKKRA